MNLPAPGRDDGFCRFEERCKEAVRLRKRQAAIFAALFSGALFGSLWVAEVSAEKLANGLPEIFGYLGRTLPPLHWETLGGDLREWYWGLGKMADPSPRHDHHRVRRDRPGGPGARWSFLSRFPEPHGPVSRLFCFPPGLGDRPVRSRTGLCPHLVFAFGLGPLPGVLAIAIHSAGALGKLFSEVNENIDLACVEGVRAAGGNWFQVIRYAVLPQVLPNFASYALLRFEINVRAAAIIGFVGAGESGRSSFS